MKLAIISEKTRYHFQKPLNYLKKIEVFHLYKTAYTDSVLEGKNLIQYKNIFQLYSKLKKIKPDLIQGMEPYYGYSRFKIPIKILSILFATTLYSKIFKIPYFFHVLENIAPERKYGVFWGKIMKFIARIYTKNALFIFYVNEGAKKNLLELGLDSRKISFGLWGIWGVDTEEFKPINKPQKRLIFIGALTEQKGILDLIYAIDIVVKKINDIKLYIIGSGPLLREIKKTISTLGLEKNVILKGEIKSNKIANYLADSYLLIAPSKELKYSAEQVGMILIEAASCGVPVISTNTGSIAEFVHDNKTGLLVEEGNSEELSIAITKIWQNEKLHKLMAQNARDYVVSKFDSRKNVKFLEKVVIEKFNCQ